MSELTNNFWHWFVVGFSAGAGWITIDLVVDLIRRAIGRVKQ